MNRPILVGHTFEFNLFILFFLLFVSTGVFAAEKNAAPSVREWQKLQGARTLVAENQFSDALRLLDKEPDNKALLFLRNVLLAQTYIGLNQPFEAMSLLETLPLEPNDPKPDQGSFYRDVYNEALLTKIQAYELQGKNSTEIKILLWSLYPDEIAEPLAVPDSRRLTRLHVLSSLKRFTEIPSTVSASTITSADLPLEDRCRALFELGLAGNKLKLFADSIQAFGNTISLHCTGENLSRSLYWKGKIENQLGQKQEAIQTYNTLYEHGDVRYQDDAAYNLWQIYQDLGDEKKAENALTQLFRISDGDMRAKALWDKGYDSFKQKKWEEAIASFNLIIQGKPAGEATPQAIYWKARALESNPKTASQSKPLYRELLNNNPFSFYAALAQARLGTTASLISSAKFNNSAANDPLWKDLVPVIDAFNAAGKHTPAQEVLDYGIGLAGGQKGIEKFLAVKYLESGDYYQAMWLAAGDTPQGPLSVDLTPGDSLLHLLYPVPFWQQVEKVAKSNGLSSGMIYGIMREESQFRNTVRSGAGAVGLMQLMPATARLKARSLGVTGITPTSLGEPSINIQLGSSYFKEVLGIFENRIPLAIMAYNAGPGNVKKWRAVRGDLPMDEFIEEIPFSETRGYVKRVLRSMRTYGLLHHEIKPLLLQKSFFY